MCIRDSNTPISTTPIEPIDPRDNTPIDSTPIEPIDPIEPIEPWPGDGPIVIINDTELEDQLWVRIYPDDFSIQTLERGLTVEEEDGGRRYWTEHYWVGKDRELRLGAWRALAARFGTQRAAWIAKTIQPKGKDQPTGGFPVSPVASANLALMDAVAALKVVAGTADIAIAQSEPSLNLARTEIGNAFTPLGGVASAHAGLLARIKSHLVTLNRLANQIDGKANNGTLTSGSFVTTLKRIQLDIQTLTGTLAMITPVTSSQLSPSTIVFPIVASKSGEWTEPPIIKGMPDRFTVVTEYNGTYEHIIVGNQVTDNLNAGLDPNRLDDNHFKLDADGNLSVDERMLWMTDFNTAVANGMGIKIKLSSEQASRGFDKLYVVGVRSGSPIDGKNILDDLMVNHQYRPEGMEFLPIGTATNNTERKKSPYNAVGFGVDKTYEIEMEAPLLDASQTDALQQDGLRFAQALGLDAHRFNHIRNTNRTDISDAVTMNKALWHATLGTYMSDIMDGFFTQDNVKRAKTYFNQFVTGRGFVPSIRVSSNPYGILPTTAFSRLAYQAGRPTPEFSSTSLNALPEADIQLRFDRRMAQLFNQLKGRWLQMANTKVKHAASIANSPQAEFMEMLGQHAHSHSYYYRYGINAASRRNAPPNESFQVNFQASDSFGPEGVWSNFETLLNAGLYYDGNSDYATYGKIKNARIFYARFLEDDYRLLGKTIDNKDLSDKELVETIAGGAQTYFEWLVTNTPDTIMADAYHDFPANSLLFFLLRHSVLLSYRETALDIMQQETLFNASLRKQMGNSKTFRTLVYHPNKELDIVSKWNFLFKEIELVNGIYRNPFHSFNPFYTYMKSKGGPNGLGMDEYVHQFHLGTNTYSNKASHNSLIARLEETKDAVARLKDIPTERLNSLMAEHLDLCSHRLDAWMLGFANRRLVKQRAANSHGIHFGAFSWLEDLRPGGARTLATGVPLSLIHI